MEPIPQCDDCISLEHDVLTWNPAIGVLHREPYWHFFDCKRTQSKLVTVTLTIPREQFCNLPLQCLRLRYNGISDTGAQRIFCTAAILPQLLELDLFGNTQSGYDGLQMIGLLLHNLQHSPRYMQVTCLSKCWRLKSTSQIICQASISNLGVSKEIQL